MEFSKKIYPQITFLSFNGFSLATYLSILFDKWKNVEASKLFHIHSRGANVYELKIGKLESRP
jgi:hypothetical protein